jgi:hypothetical protein
LELFGRGEWGAAKHCSLLEPSESPIARAGRNRHLRPVVIAT